VILAPTRGAHETMLKEHRFLTAAAAFLFCIVGAACSSEPEPQAVPQSASQAVEAPVDEIQVVLRELAATSPPEVAGGKALFEQNCSPCHGPAADGTTQGPPLVHIIYEPNHHGDASFVLAARNGVRAHHWRFGDMAPLPNVTEEMVLEIVGYIRWMQRQVGIG
jgi:mono/diheme cytochrome c family protein